MNETSPIKETTTPDGNVGRYSTRRNETGVFKSSTETASLGSTSEGKRVVVYSREGSISLAYNSDEAKARAVRSEIASLLND
jgi:hypothetical protein